MDCAIKLRSVWRNANVIQPTLILKSKKTLYVCIYLYVDSFIVLYTYHCALSLHITHHKASIILSFD